MTRDAASTDTAAIAAARLAIAPDPAGRGSGDRGRAPTGRGSAGG